jgi:hypothetical protein
MKIAVLGAAELQNFALANEVKKLKIVCYDSAT